MVKREKIRRRPRMELVRSTLLAAVVEATAGPLHGTNVLLTSNKKSLLSMSKARKLRIFLAAGMTAKQTERQGRGVCCDKLMLQRVKTLRF
jgi:hypothetical protein